MEHSETMGLSSNEVFSQLESAEGLTTIDAKSTSMMTEDELLFGNIHNYTEDDKKPSIDDLDPEERINIIVSQYEQLITNLKSDYDKKILDLQNNGGKINKTVDRDNRHMINCLKAIKKRLINKQYDKALIDTEMSIEDFESE